MAIRASACLSTWSAKGHRGQGDLSMSSIDSCEFCQVNTFKYLTELQRHARELDDLPREAVTNSCVKRSECIPAEGPRYLAPAGDRVPGLIAYCVFNSQECRVQMFSLTSWIKELPRNRVARNGCGMREGEGLVNTEKQELAFLPIISCVPG